jgi:hypothetical protein
MRLCSLNQLLEATRALAHPNRVVIIGSPSLLPAHPELGEPGQPLETSYDTNLLLTPIHEEMAAILGEAVGQQSLFAKRHDHYADILRAMLKLGVLEPAPLRAHYQATPLGEREAVTAGRNLTVILGQDNDTNNGQPP